MQGRKETENSMGLRGPTPEIAMNIIRRSPTNFYSSLNAARYIYICCVIRVSIQ